MPRPVLSDTAFNADNVATSILQQANLQIANDNLGVTDITSQFVRQSGWSEMKDKNACYYFMGFVFYNLSAEASSFPNSGTAIWKINSSTYYPEDNYHTNTITYQGDHANFIEIDTSGNIIIGNPGQFSGTDSLFRVVINGWYRT